VLEALELQVQEIQEVIVFLVLLLLLAVVVVEEHHQIQQQIPAVLAAEQAIPMVLEH
jgi:hypothetical protein